LPIQDVPKDSSQRSEANNSGLNMTSEELLAAHLITTDVGDDDATALAEADALAHAPELRAQLRKRLPRSVQRRMQLMLDPHRGPHPELVARIEASIILKYLKSRRDFWGNVWMNVMFTITGSVLGSFVSLLVNGLVVHGH
jgi:hypothetical protein